MKSLCSSAVGLLAVLVLAWPALGDGDTAARSADKPAPAAPVVPPHVSAKSVDDAIAHGVDYFWSTQNKNTGRFGSGSFGPDGDNNKDAYVGGFDVLALLSLAYAHETAKPEFQKGLAALRELEPQTTYVLGLKLILMAELYRQADHKHDPIKKTGLRKSMLRDAQLLASFQIDDGTWSYRMPSSKSGGGGDGSNTQLALLGLTQAMSCGVELDPAVLVKSQNCYLEKQKLDGGWNYLRADHEDEDTYGSMTASAVASLILIRDLLDPGLGCPCRDGHSSGRRNPQVDQAINRGIKWLGENFTAKENPRAGIFGHISGTNYWLYAGERVAMATGFKYIGPHNWYAEGARNIIAHNVGSGIPDATFGILFLIKGRAPILMNKLQYEGIWDLHPHDAANLAAYVGDAKEQQINWQVINLSIPVSEMHDAPILYISAETPLKFSDEQKQKLRGFTDSGGTILFEASCGNKNADTAWRKTCQEIWPEWELKKMDKTHPLWTADLKLLNPPLMWSASDGTRTFLLYAPLDLSCVWNLNAVDKNKGLFDLGSNLWAYTTDRGKLRSKLEDHEIGARPKYLATQVGHGSADSITVARTQHGGDWNVARNYHEWDVLAAALKPKCGLSITEAAPVAPGAAVPPGTTMLYLCGRASCELEPAGRTWLNNYLAGGGFLFAEAALGDKRFDDSLRTMISAAGLTFRRLDDSSPLITGQLPGGARGYNVTGVGYTYALRDERMGKPWPELLGIYLGEKMVGVYSPYDIMFRQTGSEAFDCRGYDADDARALAVNLALYASTLPAATPAASSGSSATPAAKGEGE